MKNRKKTSKRIRMIVFWIIFLAVMNFVIFHAETTIHFQNAKKELSDQAVTVAGQIPSFVENDLCTQVGWEMLFAKLQALSFALEEYDSIEDAQEFLGDFVQAADIQGLTIYDRTARIIYHSEDSMMLDLKADDINTILDSRVYEQSAYGTPYHYTDEVASVALSSFSLKELEQNYFWGVKDQWLILISNTTSEDWNHIESYLKWNNALRNITIGNTGSVLAVDANDGTVLSCFDSSMHGQPVDGLDIRVGRAEQSCSLEELLNVFDQPEQVEEITVRNIPYYAVRLDNPHVLMLAMLPFDEIREEARDETGMLLFLMILITGFCILYGFFHADERQHVFSDGKGSLQWDKTLLNGLKVGGVLAVAGMLLIGMYMEYLSASAKSFQYNSSKVESTEELLKNNTYAMNELQVWAEKEYLSKCSMVKCILGHTDEQTITREYLNELSDCIHIQSISVYGPEGKLRYTNSEYDRVIIDEASVFHQLLEGEPSVTESPDADNRTTEFTLKTGMSLRDENGRIDGMILITADSKELGIITGNLAVDNTLQQIWYSDGTIILIVDDNNDEKTISFVTEVANGSLIINENTQSYSGHPLSDLGIDEKKLQDYYNGSLRILQQRYFASVRRNGDHYLLVMQPQSGLDKSRVIPVVITAFAVLLFQILLILLLCLTRNRKEEEIPENVPGPEPVRKDSAGQMHRDEDVLARFGSLMNRSKPYFEERWPGDSIRWKEKTEDDKFKTAAKVLIIAAFFAIFVQAVLAGNTSVWYYSLNGNWDSGINLNSITSCVISFCVLIIVKMILHKVLYLIARAVGAKGETICHLLDSFSGYALFIAWIFICLSYLGVNATALSLTGGVAGVVFGIGCQNIVADILAGILMTFEGVVHVGDFVSYNDQVGVVLSIGVRTTRLKWFGDITIIRNNDFKNYINRPPDKETRVIVNLNIDLNESLEKIESILERELPLIHDNLCARIGEEISGPDYRGVQKISEDNVVLSFCVYCKGMYNRKMTRALNRELKLMCERNNIMIGIPQIMVHNQTD